MTHPGPSTRPRSTPDPPSERVRRVEFPSQGAVLRGRLYLPDNAGTDPSPVVVMAHGFSGTAQGMGLDGYAARFCEDGLAVLLYDHRNLGFSDGEPRQEINRWVQARGYRDAIDFLGTVPEVDARRLAVWGESLSGLECLAVAAVDPRVSAVVVQVPAWGRTLPPDDADGARFARLRRLLCEGDVRTDPRSVRGPLPVVSADPLRTPSLLEPLSAFRWFIPYGALFGTGWRNYATVGGPPESGELPFTLCAAHLETPILALIARPDEMPGAEDDIARAVFERLRGPKEIADLGGGHFGSLYQPSAEFDRSSRIQSEFLLRRLGRTARGAPPRRGPSHDLPDRLKYREGEGRTGRDEHG